MASKRRVMSMSGVRRAISVASLLALLTVAVVAPASAQVPQGEGRFLTFGPFECEGLGTVTVVAPGAATAVPTGWASTGEHLVALSFSGIFTDLEGNVFTFSRSFGAKAGLTPITCTATFEHPEGTEEFTMEVAVVPPIP
jgi:hypothetical protein